MKTSTKIALALFVAAVVAVVAYALARPGTPAPPVAVKQVEPTMAAGDTRITAEIYGDSITDGNSYGFSNGDTGEYSWASYIAENGVRFMGGFAMSGLSSADVGLHGMGGRADVVIYAIGVNDVRGAARPFEQYAENARSFAAAQTGNGARFALVAIGPVEDAHVELAREYNRRMQALAAEEGWIFLDPWVSLRDAEYDYRGETSRDEVHPNEDGARIYAEELSSQLIAALDG